MLNFKGIYSVFFARTAVVIITTAVIINVLLWPAAVNSGMDFNKISDVQKNVFSAVFFISDAVVKIGLDISGRITAAKNGKKDDPAKRGRNNAVKTNDGIMLPGYDKAVKTIKNYDAFSGFYLLLPDVQFKILCRERMCRAVVFYFMLMLLFFVSVKNGYGAVAYNFVKIYSKKPAFI